MAGLAQSVEGLNRKEARPPSEEGRALHADHLWTPRQLFPGSPPRRLPLRILKLSAFHFRVKISHPQQPQGCAASLALAVRLCAFEKATAGGQVAGPLGLVAGAGVGFPLSARRGQRAPHPQRPRFPGGASLSSPSSPAPRPPPPRDPCSSDTCGLQP